MNWFSKPLATTEIAPRLTPTEQLDAARARLHKAKSEMEGAKNAVATYRATHQDLRTAQFDGQTAVCVSAIRMHPELARLESALREKEARFGAANAAFAEAKKNAGIATYL